MPMHIALLFVSVNSDCQTDLIFVVFRGIYPWNGTTETLFTAHIEKLCYHIIIFCRNVTQKELFSLTATFFWIWQHSVVHRSHCILINDCRLLFSIAQEFQHLYFIPHKVSIIISASCPMAFLEKQTFRFHLLKNFNLNTIYEKISCDYPLSWGSHKRLK